MRYIIPITVLLAACAAEPVTVDPQPRTYDVVNEELAGWMKKAFSYTDLPLCKTKHESEPFNAIVCADPEAWDLISDLAIAATWASTRGDVSRMEYYIVRLRTELEKIR